jgi:acyl-CoA thioester hydrolase
MNDQSEQRAERTQFACVHPIRVRWAEADAHRVVFNPQYFVYFDVAYTEYMRALGVPFPDGLAELGVDMLAANATANFRAAARYDDEIEVGARVGRIGRTSMRFDYAIWRGDEALVDGSVTYVVVDLVRRTPRAVPESLRERVEAFERIPPERASASTG